MNASVICALACAAGLAAVPTVAFAASRVVSPAITLGASDDFQDGTTAGWNSGPANPTPPVNVASGGPAGSTDAYLKLTSTGASGPGSRLVAISGPQWSGNYLAAGVNAITLDVRNLGGTVLSLRLLVEGPPGSSALSSFANEVAVGGGWQHISFSLDPSLLTGAAGAALASVTQIRLYHGATAAFPGPGIVAQLGVDNISAVPEPAAALTLAVGLAALLVRHRRA